MSTIRTPQETRIYVITGGPGAGKSSVIDGLSAAGYTTIPEAAMEIKVREKKKKEQGLPYTLSENDNPGFQQLILARQLVLENHAKGITFMDRGIIDSIAYCEYWHTPIPDNLDKACRSTKYHRIFILEPLPIQLYRNEQARDETPEQARRLHDLIDKAYRKYGYTPLLVPYFTGSKEESVRRRIEFICKHMLCTEKSGSGRHN
jgi:predicted ATPase